MQNTGSSGNVAGIFPPIQHVSTQCMNICGGNMIVINYVLQRGGWLWWKYIPLTVGFILKPAIFKIKYYIMRVWNNKLNTKNCCFVKLLQHESIPAPFLSGEEVDAVMWQHFLLIWHVKLVNSKHASPCCSAALKTLCLILALHKAFRH